MKAKKVMAIPSKIGRYVVLDTETTGLHHTVEHILELAVVEILNGKISGNQFHLYIRPRKKIDPKATELHKLDQNYYSNYFEDVYDSEVTSWKNFLNFVGESLVFAHNADFDRKFINNELSFISYLQ